MYNVYTGKVHCTPHIFKYTLLILQTLKSYLHLEYFQTRFYAITHRSSKHIFFDKNAIRRNTINIITFM